MTPAEHATQRNAVRASLLLADNRTERHAVYLRADCKPCNRCGTPRSLLFCIRCDGKAAA